MFSKKREKPDEQSHWPLVVSFEIDRALHYVDRNVEYAPNFTIKNLY